MRGVISPLSQDAFKSWCSVKKKHRDNFTLYLLPSIYVCQVSPLSQTNWVRHSSHSPRLVTLLVLQLSPASATPLSLVQDILLSSLLSQALSLCSFPNVRDQVSRPYKATRTIIKVKVKLSLCFNWAPRHGGVLGEWRYSSTHSLTSALNGGEWSASRHGRFTPRNRALVTHWIGDWVGPRAVLDVVVVL
jgi:hypothetical protein